MENIGTGNANSSRHRRPRTADKESISYTDSLIKLNRWRLRKVFIEQSCGEKMSFHQFFKFCKDCLIIPELGSILEVKQTYSKFCDSKGLQWRLESTPTLAYSHFEELLQFLAEQIIEEPETSSAEKLLYHIKTPVKTLYKQNLIFEVPKLNRMQSLDPAFSPEKPRSGSQMLCREPETPTHQIPKTQEKDINWTKTPIRFESVDIKKNNKTTEFLQDAKSGNNQHVVDSNIDLALRVLNCSKDLQNNRIGYKESSFNEGNESRAINPLCRHTHRRTEIKFHNSFSIERKPRLQHKFSFEQSELKTERSPILFHNIKAQLKCKEFEAKISRVGTMQDDGEDINEFLKIEQSLKAPLCGKKNRSPLPEQNKGRKGEHHHLNKGSVLAQPSIIKGENIKIISGLNTSIEKTKAKYDFSARIMGQARKYQKTKTLNLNQTLNKEINKQSNPSSSPKHNPLRQSKPSQPPTRSAVTFSLPKYTGASHVMNNKGKMKLQVDSPKTKHEKVAASRINISRTTADCCGSLIQTYKTPTQQSAPEGFFFCSDSKRGPMIRIEDSKSIDSTHAELLSRGKSNEISPHQEREESQSSQQTSLFEKHKQSSEDSNFACPSVHQNLVLPCQTTRSNIKDLKEKHINDISNIKDKLLISQAEKLRNYKKFIKGFVKTKSNLNSLLIKACFRSWFSLSKQQTIKLSLG